MEFNTYQTQAELDAFYAAEDAAWGVNAERDLTPIEPSGNSEYLHQEASRENWNI